LNYSWSVPIAADVAFIKLQQEVHEGKVIVNKKEDDKGVLDIWLSYPDDEYPSDYDHERHTFLMIMAASEIVRRHKEKDGLTSFTERVKRRLQL